MIQLVAQLVLTACSTSALEPLLQDPAPPAAAVPSTAQQASLGVADFVCIHSMLDQATGNCLLASSVPTLGRLYPLSPELFVSPTGRVGMGNTNPQAKLDVSGTVRGRGMVSVGESSFSGDDGTAGSPGGKPGARFEGGVALEFEGEGGAGLIASGSSGVANASSPGIGGLFQGGAGLDVWGGAAGLVTVGGATDNALAGSGAVALGGDAFGGAAGSGIRARGGEGIPNGSPFSDSSGGDGLVAEAGNGETPGNAVRCLGDLVVVGGTKNFIQPHPTDPSLEIAFVCLEGNESGTYFRGSGRTEQGRVLIPVPEEFRLTTSEDGLTVQLTPRGPARLWVEQVDLDRILVRSDEDVAFDYLVNGVRRGFEHHEAIRPNRSFVPTLRAEEFRPYYRPEILELLVRNGILNPDGTPDEDTARELGWTLHDSQDHHDPRGNHRR